MTNFIHTNTTQRDKEMLFADWDNNLADEVFVDITSETKLEDIVVDHLKKFPSKSQARKNNWGGEIPMGFRQWKIGKIFFWTFKPLSDLEHN